MVPGPPARLPWARVYPLKTPLAFSLALLLGLASGSTEAAVARRGSSASAPKKKAPRAGKRAPSAKASPAPVEAEAPVVEPQASAPVAPAEPAPVAVTPAPVPEAPAPAPLEGRVLAPLLADAPRVDDTRLLPSPPPDSPARGATRHDVLSVVKKPWFWVAVGGVAAATTAGILLASQPDKPPLGVRLGNPGAGW